LTEEIVFYSIFIMVEHAFKHTFLPFLELVIDLRVSITPGCIYWHAWIQMYTYLLYKIQKEMGTIEIYHLSFLKTNAECALAEVVRAYGETPVVATLDFGYFHVESLIK
jgi:hypothetical protein